MSEFLRGDIVFVENMIQMLSEKNKRLREYENKFGNMTKGHDDR